MTTTVPSQLWEAGKPVGTDMVCEFRAWAFPYYISEISCQGPKATILEVYIGDIGPASRVDSVTKTEANTASYPTPKRVPAGSRVFVVWRGALGEASVSMTTLESA